MPGTFAPLKLIAARIEVEKKHPNFDEQELTITSNNMLLTLIKKVVSWRYEDIEKNIIKLTTRDIKNLISYIPYNFFEVNLKNLIRIFELNNNKANCELIFKHWQYANVNNAFNDYFLKLIDNGTFNEILENNNFSKDVFKSILKDQDIPGKLCYVIMKDKDYSLLESQFKYHKLILSSRLYKDCLYAYYLYCSKNEYIKTTDVNMASIVGTYTKKRIYIFIKNFLKELNLEELSKYIELSKVLTRITWNFDDYRFDSLSNNLDDITIGKYRKWLVALQIDNIFGQDARSRFWRKYQFVNASISGSVNFCIILETKRYAIIEFKGKANGPIHIFPINYYNSNVKIYLNISNNSDTKVKSKLNELGQLCNEGYYRVEHNGRWWLKLQQLLCSNDIVELIEGYSMYSPNISSI